MSSSSMPKSPKKPIRQLRAPPARQPLAIRQSPVRENSSSGKLSSRSSVESPPPKKRSDLVPRSPSSPVTKGNRIGKRSRSDTDSPEESKRPPRRNSMGPNPPDASLVMTKRSASKKIANTVRGRSSPLSDSDSDRSVSPLQKTAKSSPVVIPEGMAALKVWNIKSSTALQALLLAMGIRPYGSDDWLDIVERTLRGTMDEGDKLDEQLLLLRLSSLLRIRVMVKLSFNKAPKFATSDLKFGEEFARTVWLRYHANSVHSEGTYSALVRREQPTISLSAVEMKRVLPRLGGFLAYWAENSFKDGTKFSKLSDLVGPVFPAIF